MIRINENYLKLQASYLFSDIAKRVAAFQKAHPDKDVIRLGIGDVTRPLPAACIEAFHRAVDEMAAAATFRGYGPEQGYDFLREKIAEDDFQARGADIAADEIFVSDGAKCDNGNIQEIFATDITVAIPDPVYPVYVDTNVMAGRTGSFRRRPLRAASSTWTAPATTASSRRCPARRSDLIYLCFPNNPTGGTITKPQLKQWVDYARENKAIILFDAAYEAFIRDDAPAAFDLRDRGRPGGGDRVPQLLQDGGLHRHALRLHRGAESLHGLHGGGRAAAGARALEPAAHDQVQRRLLPRAARGRGGLQPRRAAPSAGSSSTTTCATRP